MKKISAIAAVVILIGFLASCKSHEKCPAYGKAQYKSVKKHS